MKKVNISQTYFVLSFVPVTSGQTVITGRAHCLSKHLNTFDINLRIPLLSLSQIPPQAVCVKLQSVPSGSKTAACSGQPTLLFTKQATTVY